MRFQLLWPAQLCRACIDFWAIRKVPLLVHVEELDGLCDSSLELSRSVDLRGWSWSQEKSLHFSSNTWVILLVQDIELIAFYHLTMRDLLVKLTKFRYQFRDSSHDQVNQLSPPQTSAHALPFNPAHSHRPSQAPSRPITWARLPHPSPAPPVLWMRTTRPHTFFPSSRTSHPSPRTSLH